MQVDQRQLEVIGRHRPRRMQQEMTDIAVAVIDPGAMHGTGHSRHFADQRPLQARWRRVAQPVDAEILEADGRRQLLGDDEGMLLRGIAATFAEGHGGHGRYAHLVQTLDGRPLLPGAEHGRLGGQQVLDDLAPADTAVDLDEIAAPLDLGTQGPAPFQLAVDLPLQRLHFGEGVTPGPEALEGFLQDKLHGRSARITSAACCGML
ncbi:hypothetical protein FQZ97_847560 [compost metagenome]